ncbi:Immunity protein 61 [Nocardia amikacinitolerans]|nr:Immunity protein 61 [Nocardia amikacinitolerans]
MLTKDERGLPSTVGKLRRFADVEKYILCLMGAGPYSREYRTSAPGTRWYREGVHPRVRLEKTDPTREYSTTRLYVDDETQDRGFLCGEIDAVRFSHPLVMNYEQVESIYKAGLPQEWFSLELEIIE